MTCKERLDQNVLLIPLVVIWFVSYLVGIHRVTQSLHMPSSLSTDGFVFITGYLANRSSHLAKTPSPNNSFVTSEQKAVVVEEPVSVKLEDPLLDGIKFSSLNMCSAEHGKYYCQNNHNCSLKSCVRSTSQFNFNHHRTGSFFRSKSQRQTYLKELLVRMESQFGPNEDKSLILMMFNSGFGHQFGNWYCSLLANNIDVSMLRRRMIVFGMDVNATEYAKALGFFAPEFQEVVQIKKWAKRYILPTAAVSFGRGSHTSLNLILKFGLPYDFVELGYSVYVQDVDFVWKQNAFTYVQNLCKKTSCDAVFYQEGRPFCPGDFCEADASWVQDSFREEVNSGLFFLKASNKTLNLLRLALEGVHLQVWKGLDQPLWNSLIHHKHLSSLRIELLNTRDFVPGKALHRLTAIKSEALRARSGSIVTLHASDTGSFITKIEKFRILGLWYFEKESCPLAVDKCDENPSCQASLIGDDRPVILDDTDPTWIKIASDNGW